MTISGTRLCPDSAGWQLRPSPAFRSLWRLRRRSRKTARNASSPPSRTTQPRRSRRIRVRRSDASLWACCDFAPFDPRKNGVCFFASRARSEARRYPRPSFAAGLPPVIAPYLHSLSGGTANSRKKSEKLQGYTNLTRLKSFVNLQLEIDSLHSFSSLIFALRNERILS